MKDNMHQQGQKNKLSHIKHMLFSGVLICITALSCNTLFEKDYSLKPEEYQKLGMPEYKKIWTSDDYSGANITLSTLKMNYPLSLPRSNSKKSGELFKRIVNEENLDFIYDTTLQLKVRAYLIQYYPKMIREVEQMYTVENEGELYYSDELLHLKEFELLIFERMLELAGIINNSDDESLSGFKDGMVSIRNYYLNCIHLLLGEMGKQEFIATDGIERLGKKVSASIITNSEWMNQSNKKDLSSELNNAIQKSESAELRNNLKLALEKLK